MPSRFIKQNSDINVWAAVIGDAMSRMRQLQQLNIVLNANNPPTVQAGTCFQVYGTDTFTSPTTPSTGNNVYPANTALTYYLDGIIFELVNQTFAWNTAAGPTSAGIPTLANSTTYYLFCTGSQDVNAASRGKGIYGVSTNAPTWDAVKMGYYSSDGLVIATFKTDGSGNVGDLVKIYPLKSNSIYQTTLAGTAQTIDTGATIYIPKNTPFEVIIIGIGGSGAANSVGVFINNDLTTTNYYRESVDFDSTSGSPGRANENRTFYLADTSSFLIRIIGSIDNTGYTRLISNLNYKNSTITLGYYGVVHNVAQTAITQITIKGSAANCFGIGTKVIIRLID